MSVIRQPGVLGRTTQRRLVGVAAAVSAAAIETIAFTLWFVLVVDSPSLSVALAGLGLLFCGALLRTAVFGAATSRLVDVIKPRRLAIATTLTACWIVWLLLAETIGGPAGVLVAALFLALALSVQFALERRVFDVKPAYDSGLAATVPASSLVLPALVIALGATTLLAGTWFSEWTFTRAIFSAEGSTVYLEIRALEVGVLFFALCSLLAQRLRFRWTIP
ncbi:hypothetical protein ACYJ1Y_09595 [Natrialbaceae archaeon A-gly3]